MGKLEKPKHEAEIPENINLKTGKPKIKSGRPRVEINLEEAEKLGMMQCTIHECSAWMNIPVGTLANREDFTNAYTKGKEKGKISLRRLNLQHAQTSPPMAMFLSKNILGYKDSPEPQSEARPLTIVFKPHQLAESESDE